jgi:hypothetical protein
MLIPYPEATGPAMDTFLGNTSSITMAITITYTTTTTTTTTIILYTATSSIHSK